MAVGRALRHFGRAAEACYVSQPTLSTQLKQAGGRARASSLVERNPAPGACSPATGEQVVRAGPAPSWREAAADPRSCAPVPQATPSSAIDPAWACSRPSAPYLLPHVVHPSCTSGSRKLELLLVEARTEEVLEAPPRTAGIDVGVARTSRCTTRRACTRSTSSRRTLRAGRAGRGTSWRRSRSPTDPRRARRGNPCCSSRTGTACATRRSTSAACPARRRNPVPRHQPRDLAADGRGRRRRDLAAGALGARADRATCEHPSGEIPRTRAEPPHRPGLAQVVGHGSVLQQLSAEVGGLARAQLQSH